MLSLWIRIPIQALKGLFVPKQKGICDSSTIEFRVWPTDLDYYFHMNNAAYYNYMEIARMHLMWRTGLFKTAKKLRWMAPLAASKCIYLRPLQLFQKFSITTRICHLDEKWIYVEHTFKSKGKVVAKGLIRALILENGKFVPTKKMAERLGYDLPDQPMPEQIKHWNQLDKVRTLSSSNH